MYKVVPKGNGKYGLQRVGSLEVHGNFDCQIDAMTAAGMASGANYQRHEETI